MVYFMESNVKAPLYLVAARVAAFWILADVGYFVILPILGIELSYNTSPIAIALYFLVWSGISVWYFWDIFVRWLVVDSRIWLCLLVSLGFAVFVGATLMSLSYLPVLRGPALVPFTDILFATPWYFVPKATEILVQQLLITVLILVLSERLRSLYRVCLAYALLFGGIHVLVFVLSGSTTQYAAIMTTAAVASAGLFPYLVLRVRSGFVYSYILHLSFYVLLALVLHTWPPPGYAGIEMLLHD